jgi:hypothetical protein
MANFDELKKNVGQVFRIRPYPFVVTGYSDAITALSTSGPKRERVGQDADYDWQLETVDATAKTATLVCLFTRHKVTLNGDDIRDHRKPHEVGSGTDGRPALMLKSKLFMEPDGLVVIDPT